MNDFFWLRARRYCHSHSLPRLSDCAYGSSTRAAARGIGKLFHQWLVAFHRDDLACTMLCPVDHQNRAWCQLELFFPGDRLRVNQCLFFADPGFDLVEDLFYYAWLRTHHDGFGAFEFLAESSCQEAVWPVDGFIKPLLGSYGSTVFL